MFRHAERDDYYKNGTSGFVPGDRKSVTERIGSLV